MSSSRNATTRDALLAMAERPSVRVEAMFPRTRLGTLEGTGEPFVGCTHSMRASWIAKGWIEAVREPGKSVADGMFRLTAVGRKRVGLPELPGGGRLFAWKRLADGTVSAERTADSKEALFESCGFGAVDMDRPVKGFLAVEVRRTPSGLREVGTGE